jgi:glycosyltransferase involved in cell wall biosynthesis
MRQQNTDQKHGVAFVNSSLSWGGGEKWHYEAAVFLRERDYTVFFFCVPGSEIDKRLKSAGITTESVQIGNLSFLNLRKRIWLTRRFRELGVRTVLLNSPADVKTAAPAARAAGIRNILFRRGLPHPIKNNFLNRWLFRHVVTGVIANSQSVATTLSTNTGGIVPDERITIIENGIKFDDQQHSAPLTSESQSRIVLGNAGRMVKQKNQRILLDIAAQLVAEKMDFLIIIAGAGKLEKGLKAEIQELGLNNYFLLPGFVTDIQSLFCTIDIFVFPSLYEGSSNALIEAAGAGLPIIASDIPPNREILTDPSLGRLVPVNDVNAYVAAVKELAANEQLRNQLGQKVCTEVRNRFSLDRTRELLLQVV